MKRTIFLPLLLANLFSLSAQEYLLPLWEKDIPNYQFTDEQEEVHTDQGMQLSLIHI